MNAPRSYVTPATARVIKGAVRRGFATSKSIQDPIRELSIYRVDRSGPGSAIVIVDEFVVRQPEYQPVMGGDDGASITQIQGTIRRFIPETFEEQGGTRLRAGDRFELPEVGPCIVRSIRPDRFGIEQASFTLEEGAS